jgi:hypothetical protein
MSTVVDPAVTTTAITVMIVALVTVVLNMMDRMIERREKNSSATS